MKQQRMSTRSIKLARTFFSWLVLGCIKGKSISLNIWNSSSAWHTLLFFQGFNPTASRASLRPNLQGRQQYHTEWRFLVVYINSCRWVVPSADSSVYRSGHQVPKHGGLRTSQLMHHSPPAWRKKVVLRWFLMYSLTKLSSFGLTSSASLAKKDELQWHRSSSILL